MVSGPTTGREHSPAQQQKSEVVQLCLTVCNPMDCSLPGSSVHEIFQARVVEWVAISFSRRSSRPRDWPWFSCIVGRRFTLWATRDPQKIVLKIYWAWPDPSEQDPVSHTVSLSHQEASISLLSFSIRGQTEWKPQSQKANQTYHMDLSRVQLFATPWTAACQASLSITNSQSLLKLMSFESMMPSNHLILCHPLLLLPSIFPSIRVFFNESVPCIRWPKYWSFSFSISPSNEYSGWISFRIDWFDLLAVPGTLKSLLQHHSSKASILRRCFLYIQLFTLHTTLTSIHQFFGTQLSSQSNSHIHTRPLEKP